MEEFESGHNDRVTVLHVNFDGSKILTASIDHRVKVWGRDKFTGEQKLIDTFTAHDADIRDAKFLHPTTGTHIATIGNDLKFHLWTEDASQSHNSGRRFRRISTISSTPRVPFVSLDLKTVDYTSTYLALIDRQGLLSIYEPTNPDEFREWTLLDQFNICSPPPGRGEETCFKVRFDPNSPPLAYTNNLTDDRTQLNLVVTALNEVKIFRSSSPHHQDTPDDNSTGASHRLMFHESAKLPTHPTLVRDVAWSPFNIRGVDRLATACKDGSIRIFELGVTENLDLTPSSALGVSHRRSNSISQTHLQPYNPRQQQQSSLTSAITGGNPTTTTSTVTSSRTNPAAQAYLTKITSTTLLSNAHVDAWSVLFDPQGQILMSCGSDGVTKLWRRSVVSSEPGREGKWMLFADQAVEIGGAESEGEENGEGVEDLGEDSREYGGEE